MKSLLHRISHHWLSGFHHSKAVHVFCKALVAYSIIRLLLLWNLVQDIGHYSPVVLPANLVPRLVFYPGVLAEYSISYFLILCLIVWTGALIFRWNYVLAILFCWLNLNLYRIANPIANGSDLVLAMLSVWTIGMATLPAWKNRELQNLIFNGSVFMAQLQIVFIYFLSGWDKLISGIWRSGEAFGYISSFTFSNPWFESLLGNSTIQIILSWAIIVFEIGFAVGIWFEKTRWYFLLIGIVFHLLIIVVLTLPDFGIMMILSYLIFLRDSDYDRIRKIFTRSPQ
jgi:hypothetical protein